MTHIPWNLRLIIGSYLNPTEAIKENLVNLTLQDLVTISSSTENEIERRITSTLSHFDFTQFDDLLSVITYFHPFPIHLTYLYLTTEDNTEYQIGYDGIFFTYQESDNIDKLYQNREEILEKIRNMTLIQVVYSEDIVRHYIYDKGKPYYCQFT